MVLKLKQLSCAIEINDPSLIAVSMCGSLAYLLSIFIEFCSSIFEDLLEELSINAVNHYFLSAESVFIFKLAIWIESLLWFQSLKIRNFAILVEPYVNGVWIFRLCNSFSILAIDFAFVLGTIFYTSQLSIGVVHSEYCFSIASCSCFTDLSIIKITLNW